MYNFNMNVAAFLFFAIVLFVGRVHAVSNSLKIAVEGELLPFNFSDNALFKDRVDDVLGAMAMRCDFRIEVPDSQWVDWSMMIKDSHYVQDMLLPGIRCPALKQFNVRPETKPTIFFRQPKLTSGPSIHHFEFSLTIPRIIVYGTCNDCYKTRPALERCSPITSDWDAEFNGLFMRVQTSWPKSGQPLDITQATITLLSAVSVTTRLFSGIHVHRTNQMSGNHPQLLATMGKIKENLQTSDRLRECLKKLMKSAFYGLDSMDVAPNAHIQNTPIKRQIK